MKLSLTSLHQISILRRQFSSLSIDPWPKYVKHLKGTKALEIAFTDGKVYKLPAELLRVLSPAANSLRHQQVVVAGRKHVDIMRIESIGNYAIRVLFDDLHNTGLYTWAQLYDLGSNKIAHMRTYLKTLKTQGLSRDPRKNLSPRTKRMIHEQNRG